MKVEVYRNKREIFCVVYGGDEEDILLNEENIRHSALEEEALTAKEEEIIMNSDFIITPREKGGFYVEFREFFE